VCTAINLLQPTGQYSWWQGILSKMIHMEHPEKLSHFCSLGSVCQYYTNQVTALSMSLLVALHLKGEHLLLSMLLQHYA